MNDLFDTLENCIAELQQGDQLELVLQRHPESADELRPILEAAVIARQLRGEGPSIDTIRRSRAKVLQRATHLRETGSRAEARAIPLFQRLALTLTVTALFLATGTGFVRASSGALPGENLYVVKRTWENVRFFLVLDAPRRLALAGELGNERLSEVQSLLARGRHEQIRFGGVFMDLNGDLYVSGIRVVLTPATVRPTAGLHTGAGVLATGRTNAEGYVELLSLELLQSGAVVPVGNPVEVAAADNAGPNTSNPGMASDSGLGATQATDGDVPPTRFQIEGTIRSMAGGVWVVNQWTVYVASASVSGQAVVGTHVEMEGYFDAESRFIVTRVEVEHATDKDSEQPEPAEDGDEREQTEDEPHDPEGGDDSSESSGPGGG
jgi:hypothetical protein